MTGTRILSAFYTDCIGRFSRSCGVGLNVTRQLTIDHSAFENYFCGFFKGRKFGSGSTH